MWRNLGLMLFSLLTILLSACQPKTSACQDPLGCQVIPPGATIQVGYFLPLSGEEQDHGEDILQALQLAFDERQGMLLDHPLELVGEDADCAPEDQLAAATRLALQKRLAGVLGFRCPQPDEAALFALSNAGLVSLGFSLAPAEVPGYYRFTTTTGTQGQAAANFACSQLSARRAAGFSQPDPASQGALQAFSQAFQAAGGEIVFEKALPASGEDLPAVLLQLASLSPELPDVLFLPLSQHAGSAAIRQLRSDPAFSSMRIIAGADLFTDSLLLDLGASAEGLYLVAPYLDTPAYTAFLQRWSAKYGRPPAATDHSLAYDASILLFEAITQVADRLPGGSLSIGRQELRQALGSSATSQGLSGAIGCQPSGECSLDRRYAVYLLADTQTPGAPWPPEQFWITP